VRVQLAEDFSFFFVQPRRSNSAQYSLSAMKLRQSPGKAKAHLRRTRPAGNGNNNVCPVEIILPQPTAKRRFPGLKSRCFRKCSVTGHDFGVCGKLVFAEKCRDSRRSGRLQPPDKSDMPFWLQPRFDRPIHACVSQSRFHSNQPLTSGVPFHQSIIPGLKPNKALPSVGQGTASSMSRKP
jgi:hypothetical protein